MQELDFQMLIQRLSRVDPLDPRNAGVVRARLSCCGWLACSLRRLRRVPPHSLTHALAPRPPLLFC